MRTLNPGTINGVQVFVKVTIKDGELSISGVEGPLRNGDCRGSSGQIDLRIDELSDGWTEADVAELKAIWKRWHLNHMRAGCSHQRSEGWADRPIDPSKPLDTYGKHFEGQTVNSWNMLVWITRSEHDKGLLSQPCYTCGYKYGTAWLSEELPYEVENRLASFPESTRDNPWYLR